MEGSRWSHDFSRLEHYGIATDAAVRDWIELYCRPGRQLCALDNKVHIVHRLRVARSDAACLAIDPMRPIYSSLAEYPHVIEFGRRNQCCVSIA